MIPQHRLLGREDDGSYRIEPHTTGGQLEDEELRPAPVSEYDRDGGNFDKGKEATHTSADTGTPLNVYSGPYLHSMHPLSP